jgi:eukaryotic-like serine/threonine-protein kinase
MPDVIPGQTLDQYLVEDVIARSGMATIFRARDTESGHPVVLKVPHMQFESDLVFHQRFEREEEIGLRLDHPGVVRMFEPRRKSRVYIAMELVGGESLRDVLRREGPLPIPKAVEIGTKIADVLLYLHEHGVIHRDLKPENVMLLPDGGVKIMDFGIAADTRLGRMTWGGLSQTMGTPDYMPPEQIKGHRGDARTDLYSLGSILYEMLAGQVPFPAENVYAAMHAKAESLPPSPRKLRPEISLELEELVLSLLEREPANRPESALEVREKLAHPGSVVLIDRTHRTEPAFPASARLAAGVIGLAALFGVFRALVVWLRR